jgi:signal recognition particle receptor subunit beta
MSIINPLSREISAKIVFYGPGLSGKTTSLKRIYESVNPDRRGEFVSLATETDRTIFFDFLPLRIEKVRGMTVRLQLYTVPGQVFYAATRKLVLNGADGVVFVADSQEVCRDANLESLEGLRDNLASLGVDIESFPLVFQYNKRDLEHIMPVEEMRSDLNSENRPEFSTSATVGEGVMPTLKEITRLVIHALWKRPLGAGSATSEQQSVVDESGEPQADMSSGLPEAAESKEMHKPVAPQQSRSKGKRPVAADSIVAKLATIADASATLKRDNAKSEQIPEADLAATDKETEEEPGGTAWGQGVTGVWRTPPKEILDKQMKMAVSPSLPASVSGRPTERTRFPVDEETGAKSYSEPHIVEKTASFRPVAESGVEIELSFSELWREESERDEIVAIETNIRKALYGEAVRNTATVLAHVLHSLPGPNSGEGIIAKATALGLDGREYIKLSKLAILPDEAIGRDHALFALYLLIAARIKMTPVR